MAGEIYQVYDFSTNLTAGFTATLVFEDGDHVPFDLGSAVMVLTRQSDSITEFNWTSTSGLITILAAGKLIINVPQSQMTPSVWITALERYPYQIYDYVLRTYDGASSPLPGISGSFTILQF